MPSSKKDKDNQSGGLDGKQSTSEIAVDKEDNYMDPIIVNLIINDPVWRFRIEHLDEDQFPSD